MKSGTSWRLLCASELQAIQQGLTPLVQAWQQHNLCESAHLRLSVARADPASMAALDCRISLLDQAQRVCAQLACASSFVHWLQDQAGLGHPGMAVRSMLAHRASMHLLRDLLARLAKLPAGSACHDSLFSMCHERLVAAPGWGAVQLSLQPAAQAAPGMLVILTQPLISRWCQPLPPKRGGLSARQGLAEPLTLRYRVLAGSLELPLGALAQLEPGDVLRLDTHAGSGLQLETTQGQKLCRADLGLHAGQPTLQVCSQ